MELRLIPVRVDHRVDIIIALRSAVCTSFGGIIPGHVHLNKVGEYAMMCIRDAGGVPFEFDRVPRSLSEKFPHAFVNSL